MENFDFQEVPTLTLDPSEVEVKEDELVEEV